MAQKEIAGGKDETSILQDFVLRYGVKVLSTPPAGAFNSTVWILPGVAILAGLAAAALVVRKWRRRPQALASTRSRSASDMDPVVLAAVEEEMRKSGVGD